MEFQEAMKKRRAINFFDPAQDVTDDEVKHILEVAALAPSSMNFQPWQVIVVRAPDAKAKLMQVAMNQKKIIEASVTLIILADMTGWYVGHPTVEKVWDNLVELGYESETRRSSFENGPKKLYGSPERSLAFAVKNAAFFSMALMLAAADIGLDSHPMDGFDHDALREAFDIPEHFFVPLIIALGHFNKNFRLLPPKWRKSRDELVWKQI